MRPHMCVQRFKIPVVRTAERDTGPLTLSNCRELRELEICPLRLGPVELDLISSITSTNIQRIIFTQCLPPYELPLSDIPHWPILDDSLCRLVDRLECGRRLEVEFRGLNALAWWGGELGFKKCLPRSYEKGVTRGG